MPTFLDNLSEYNAKASLAISNSVSEGKTEKANMMSSLKTTANDTTLSEEIRLNALTALINLGSLLDIPLPPYFPVVTTYPDTQTYVGVHNDLTGIQGGQAGEYYHLTQEQWTNLGNAATAADVSFANLQGVYTDNASLVSGFAAKQNTITAPSAGTFFLKINGSTLSYDSNSYLSSISEISAGGELSGQYPNPTLLNNAVINKVLAGWNGSATYSAITSSDSILSGMEKLNARISEVIANPAGVASVQVSTNNSILTVSPTSPGTGAVTIGINWNTQTANTFLAAPNGTNGAVSFRTIANDDLPASGAGAGTYGSTSYIPVVTVNDKGIITGITTTANAAGGQVNSVDFVGPGGVFVDIGNTGTAIDPIVGFTLDDVSANTVWAGPSSGAADAPDFRALVLDDIASITIPQSQIEGLEDTLSTFLTGSLAHNTMYVGNGSDAAVAGTVSGDLGMVYFDNNGADEASFTIQDGVVTYAKIQDVTSGKILGRYSLTDGPVQNLTLDPTAFTLNNTTGVIGLQTPNPSLLTQKGDLLTRNASAPTRLGIGANATIFMADTAVSTGNKWVAMSGDVSIATTGATTIANNAVTFAKMQTIADGRILGNNSGNPAVPSALTGTNVTALLDLFDTTTTTKGLVAGSNGADNTHFLRADNTWQPVTGTGTVTSVSVVQANGFDGTVANDTTTPAITLITTVTGILKGNGTAMSAAVAGTDYVAPGQITATSGPGSGLTMVTGKLLGRATAGTNAIEAISVNSSLFLSLVSGTPTLGINLGNGNIFTAQQQMPSIKLNGTTSGYVSFAPPATAGTQAYTLPSAYPSSGAARFLTSDGSGNLSWAIPTGTATSFSVEFNNSGLGDASGTTFNGSVARTISYNTIGAQALSSNLTSLSGVSYGTQAAFVKMTGANTFTLDTNTYVTNVTFTGGLISVANGSTTPAFTVAGTQGGIVYFSSASTWASSPALDQYELMMGGGTGAPTTINTGANQTLLISNGSGNAPSWTTATYLATTSANRILYSSANNVIDEIVAPSTADRFLKWDGSTFTWAAAGGGGGGTVGSGSVGQLAVYTAGTTVNGFSSINSIIYGDASGAASNLTYATSPNLYLRVNSSGTGLVWDTAGSGSGTVNNGQEFAVAYYPNTGTTVDDITPPNTNGGWFLYSNVTASAAVAPEWLASTGSGNVVRATSPTLTTPNIGAATAASINGLTITASTGTLTIANGSTLATSGAFSTTLTATGTTTITLPTTGTLATLAGVEILSNKTLLSPQIGDAATNGHAHFRKASNTIPTGFSNYATLWFPETGGNKRMAVMWDNVGYASEFQFNAASAQTYTLPNASGTVALIDSTQTLTIPAGGGNSADLVLGVSGGGSVSLLAPATVTGAGAYTLPSAYPAAATTYFLTSNTTGTLTWAQITGGGNVVGPGSSTAGNFAVYADGTGLLLANTSVATLSSTGRATFNDGVDVGVSGPSGTTGMLVFRNSANAGRTIIQASSSQVASDINYYWPSGQGALNQVLANDGSGNLFWTAAGTGNVNTGSANAFTNTNTFSSTVSIFGSGTFRIQNTTTSFYSVLRTNANFGDKTITFPDLTGTVALLENSQTFTGNKTFRGNLLIDANTGGSLTINSAASTSVTILTSLAFTTDKTITFPNVTGTVALINVGQTFTGTQIFRGNLLIDANTGGSLTINSAASTSVTNFISAANGGNTNITFPNLSGTVALLENSQTFTGNKTFRSTLFIDAINGGSLVINNATTPSTSVTILTSLANSSDKTVAFPNFSGTVALLENAQAFTGAKTFSTATTTFNLAASTGTAISISGVGTPATAQMTFSGGTMNWINFGTNGINTPALTGAAGATRSAGTKIVLYPNLSSLDLALGVTNSTTLWMSSAGAINFYTNASTTIRATIDSSGLTLADSALVAVATTANVFNTVATTINIGGAATTMSIGNTATTAQTVNMFTASTGASTYNFATGATANATTKTINIGTGGAAGSTTNITFGTSTTTNLRFFGSANTSGKPTVTGSRAGNAALASFLTALSNLGLITDSTTA